MSNNEQEELRLDKYLWAVRLFKTRSQASEACRSGRIKKDGIALKASHIVKVGEQYDLVIEQLHRKVAVKALLHNRVSAKLVEDYLIDLTPAAEYERIQAIRQYGFEQRDRGTGRPTKKDRREIERFKYK